MLKKSRLLLSFSACMLGLFCNEALAIFASPINAGCYIAAPGQCKIHVEPVTINIATGKRLVFYQFVVFGAAGSRVIYDFRTDQSNPAPLTGDTYSPSAVMQDFAATCGASYTISLQGRDTGDASAFNLGLTNTITCPATAP